MFPIKIIVSVAAAISTAALIIKAVKKDEDISEEPSDIDKRKELQCLLRSIYWAESSFDLDITLFYITLRLQLNVNVSSIKKTNYINIADIDIDDKEISLELIKVLTEYKTLLSSMQDCFQSNADFFKNECSKFTGVDWKCWNQPLRFAYRDITILIDAITDTFFYSEEEVFDVEGIKSRTEVLRTLQEHYSNKLDG